MADGSRRATWILALGAATGLALAASGIAGLGAPAGGLGPRAVARVNGTTIRLEDYRRTLAVLANDRREEPGAAERQLVLDRLVDEELLVQRGLELGLARDDARVRRDLVAAVVDAVVASAESAAPTAEEVRTFYARHRDRFVRPGRFAVRQVWCRVDAGQPEDAAHARAVAAAERLRAGADFAAVAAALGDREIAPLPSAPLPAKTLVDYLGPTGATTVLGLEPGAVSAPVRLGTGYHVLQVVDRTAAETPPLAEIEAEVAAEVRRAAGEAALRAYLDDLRARADVQLAAIAP